MAMKADRRRVFVVTAVGLMVAAVGLVFAGARTPMRETAPDALQQRNRHLMAIERRTAGRHEAGQRQWRAQVDRIDEAVLVGDTRGAVKMWREAYVDAMRHGQWRDVMDVGDVALRIGDVAELRESPQAAARRSYLTGLQRALAQNSLDGVLRAAEAFSMLGDRAVVENCLVLAGRIAGDDVEARGRVRAFADRFVTVATTAP